MQAQVGRPRMNRKTVRKEPISGLVSKEELEFISKSRLQLEESASSLVRKSIFYYLKSQGFEFTSTR